MRFLGSYVKMIVWLARGLVLKLSVSIKAGRSYITLHVNKIVQVPSKDQKSNCAFQGTCDLSRPPTIAVSICLYPSHRCRPCPSLAAHLLATVPSTLHSTEILVLLHPTRVGALISCAKRSHWVDSIALPSLFSLEIKCLLK